MKQGVGEGEADVDGVARWTAVASGEVEVGWKDGGVGLVVAAGGGAFMAAQAGEVEGLGLSYAVVDVV